MVVRPTTFNARPSDCTYVSEVFAGRAPALNLAGDGERPANNPAGWWDVRAFVVRMRRSSGALGWLLGCGFAAFVAIHFGPFTVSIFVSQ
jgi:hypothetical protein